MNYAFFRNAVIVLAIFAFVHGIINVRTHLKNPEKMDKKKFQRHYYLSYVLTFIEAFILGRICYANTWNTRWRFRRVCI